VAAHDSPGGVDLPVISEGIHPDALIPMLFNGQMMLGAAAQATAVDPPPGRLPSPHPACAG